MGFETLQSQRSSEDISEITDAIVGRAEETRIDDKTLAFGLSYGSKSLSLLYSEARGSFATHVGNSNLGERLPNETTLLYAAARKIMSSLAGRREEAVRYELMTRNPEMLAWAKESGDQLFHWKHTESLDMLNEDGSPGAAGIFQAEVLPE